MSDIAAVRKEIKTWERRFKSENGRDPSIQDIKDQPSIAEKYKLYKKLSKAAAVAVSFNTSTSSDVPSTPRSQPSYILSNQRAVVHTAPLSSFNPFSPVKNKGKQKIIRQPIFGEHSRSNPFATPIKGKSTVEKKELSPDPFPVIQPSQFQAPISNFQLPATTALSRARKRLRGEPVSPSPNKEKRPRVGSLTSLPFMKVNSQLGSSDDGDDLDAREANSSFVDDSPVKAPTGGKPFKLLFEEAVPSNTKPGKIKTAFPETCPAPAGLCGEPSDPVFGNNLDTNAAISGVMGDRRKEVTSRNLSSEDDLFLNDGKPRQGSMPGPSGLYSGPRTSVKRSLSDTELEHNESITSTRPLLPPSPPTVDAYARGPAKYKGKEKAKGVGRKKVKVVKETGSEEDDGSDEGSSVKVVSHRHAHHAEDDQDLDLCPILRFRAHRRPHGATAPMNQQDDTNKFEVDLPDRIRSVLAISSSKPQDAKEERVVHGLLYGGRVSRYDPMKGGEIWNVGELEDESQGNTEGEDDWEGEPVPWGVGEL